MGLNDWAVILPLIISALTAVGSAIAWLSGWGRREAAAQREATKVQAEANQVIAQTAADLLRLREALGVPLEVELKRRAQEVKRLTRQVSALREALADLPQLRVELARYKARVAELEAELEDLRPYKAKVATLEDKLAETLAELALARENEAALQTRVRKLEGG